MKTRLLYASRAQIGNRGWKLATGSWKLVLAIAIDEGLERTAELGRQIVFANRMEEGNG